MTDVHSLVEKLTLEEKVSLLNGRDFWRLRAIERLGMPTAWLADGPHGLRKQASDGEWAETNDSLPAVAFPTSAALACSFDRALVREVGEALGEICQEEEVTLLLGPGANIKRSPLCGRSFEYFSEDPYLTGELAAAHIAGVQSRGVGACLKHFAMNNQEHRRMTTNVVCDERTMREIYLTGFERAVKQSMPRAVMCAYNRVGGTFCSENRRLLTDILRGEWGFDGCTVTDWGACNDHAAGIEAGMDIAMPSLGEGADAEAVRAVREGRLSEAAVTRAAEDVLRLVYRFHDTKKKDEDFFLGVQHHLARRVARESAVLLKNEGLLPLRSAGRIAFIGEFAEQPRFQGGGSSHINAAEISSALWSVRSVAAVEYARGYRTDTDEVDEALIAEAAELAARSDRVVLFAGLPDAYESEGYDRTHLRLPENQLRLIEAVACANPETAVVLHNGSPVEMPWAGSVKAILEMYLGGEAVGEAAVDLLFGAVSPCGKLAETFPLRLEDTPAYLWFPGDGDTVEYREGLYVGYRWYDARRTDVLWPFGHGLSYSSFAYSDLRIGEVQPDGTLTVSVDVTNTGRMGAKEIVQVYVHSAHEGVSRPEQELKGFEKVYIAPGKTETVHITLDARAFAYYDTELSDWYTEPGAYELRVGASSRDIRLTGTICLSTAPKPSGRVDGNTCLGDVLRRPGAEEVMRELMGGVGGLFDPEVLAKDKMLLEQNKYMPLRALAWFSNGTMTDETQAELIRRLNAL